MSNIIDSIRLSGTTYQIQGEITVDAALDSGSTNPVANSAITTALYNKVNVVDNEVPDYNVTSQITYQGGYPSQSETASTWDSASMFTLRYTFFRMSDTDFTTTAAVIDPSGNITARKVTTSETNIGNPLPNYIDMSFSLDDNAYRFTAKEGYRIAHLDIYSSRFGSYGTIIEERVDTVFEGGQSADVIKDVIEPALINKQDQLVSGTNIKTINNTSILGSGNIDIQGGGKAIEAGRGISITTGETADTINCTLPISADTRRRGTNLIFFDNPNTINHNNTTGNFIVGYNNTFGNYYDQAQNNFVFGNTNTLEGYYQGNRCLNNFVVGNNNFFGSMSAKYAVSNTAVFGQYNKPKNNYEFVFGQYNNSVSASTTFGDSGNTLFSVGNGTADNARHNAFEIRQNGDIYLSLNGQDVKLQDQLGGSSYTAGNGIDITNDVISVTGKADTSAVTEVSDALTAHTANTTVHTTAAEKSSWNGAATNASNALMALGGLSLIKLTQAEYDALSPNYDSNKLYVIVN